MMSEVSNATKQKLLTKTYVLQRNIASLLKLLGGTEEERLRYFEIIKGLTTPAEYRRVDRHIKTMHRMVKKVASAAKAVQLIGIRANSPVPWRR